MKTLLTVAMLVGASALAGAQERLSDQLRKGIVQEEVNQNLTKAIEAYQAIVAQFDEERRTAASALYRLAECSRKAGKREQALAAYQRVVREFPDQASLVDSSRRQLTSAFGLSNVTGARVVAPAEGSASSRERAIVNSQREKESIEKWQLIPERRISAREWSSTSPEETKIQMEALRERIAEAQKLVERSLLSPSDIRDLQTQYQAATLRYEEQVKKREAEKKAEQEARLVTERMMKSVEAEILLLRERMSAIQKKIEVGMTSTDDPELLQLKRDVLGLQRKLDELKSGFKR
jgi:tetratricopeptide (TPR) repeat protein